MQKHKIPFKEKSLSAISVGNPANTSVVLIHGNSMSSKIWERQFVKSLSDKHHLISFDLPGHGESDNIDTYSLAILAESVSTTIEYFNLNNYILVGNSLGGDLILQIPQKLKKCRGVMLINTPPVGKPPTMDKAFQPNPLIGMFFTKDYDPGNIVAFIKIFLSDSNNVPNFIKSDFVRSDGLSRQSLAEAVGALNYKDEVEVVKNLTVPVAIILGKNEKMVNNEYYKGLNIPMLWQNKIQYIEESAHCPQWENADTFNALLLDFCNAVLN